ncbi:AMP-binding protein, partial [Thalassotalea sp. G20_0]|uniref:AMP-binding protein n=1 Tax=Thalassotalea sp. G20_0 TaxID=2821093 RepID=UPI001ADB3B29|nr:AMP-binding protein [Thalassotalea sp. G20_0]
MENYQVDDWSFCPENDAYVLYTSGSTGVPNGVRISHRAMIDFFNAVNVYMGVEQRSRCLNTSAMYFDVSVVDTLLPLYQGASVWLSPEFPMPLRIIELIEQEQITHLCGVGSTQTVLTSTPGFEQRSWPHLKTIMTGAEVLNPKTMQQWIDVAPNVHILNGYGPTEATCVCTVFTINAANVDKYEAYPIGSPLAGISVLIDESNDSESEQGELWIAGSQLLTGYLNRPDLNENRIVVVNGTRYYRTGDLVERDDQGKLIFLGRCDDQVKVRGYRIHLDDVATPFRNQKEISDAVAVNIKHDQLGECLVIVVNTNSSSDRWAAVFESAKSLLPPYMRPKF